MQDPAVPPSFQPPGCVAHSASQVGHLASGPAEGAAADRPPIPLTDDERSRAWRLAGYGTASDGHQAPVALWLIGPSAVGKSTLASAVAVDFGISQRSCEGDNGESPAYGLDAVAVDGVYFRDVHAGYQEWVTSSEWWTAYPTYKPVINEEKQALLRAAAGRRQHLVIPHTCLNLKKCVSIMNNLKDQGYTNHVLAVYGPKGEVARRGVARERREGKRYACSEYESSIAAFGPLVKLCNGRYRVVRVREQESSIPCASGTGHYAPFIREVMATGEGGSELDFTPEVQE